MKGTVGKDTVAVSHGRISAFLDETDTIVTRNTCGPRRNVCGAVGTTRAAVGGIDLDVGLATICVEPIAVVVA